MFNLERYEEALKWWRRALEVNPNLFSLELNLKTLERILEERRKKAI
jgi:tetratricopeptide (TPR) repeat protein